MLKHIIGAQVLLITSKVIIFILTNIFFAKTEFNKFINKSNSMGAPETTITQPLEAHAENAENIQK